MRYLRVTEILSRLQSFKHIDKEVLEAKADIGTNVHEAINNDLTGNPQIELSNREQAYFDSYKMLKKPECFSTENRYYDDALIITGQIDVVARFNEGLCLIDWKTSAKANHEIWKMQAHFYWYLLKQNGVDISDVMYFVNLRHRKVFIDGDLGEKITYYEPIIPTIHCYMFENEVLEKCIEEAHKSWSEIESARCVD
jgi:hypothetical protein